MNPIATAPPKTSSALRFDVSHPELAQFAAARGWFDGDARPGIVAAELAYTTDGWRTTKRAAWSDLARGRGFLLRSVAPGTAVEFAVKVTLGVSRHGLFTDERAELWVNNRGRNLTALTTAP